MEDNENIVNNPTETNPKPPYYSPILHPAEWIYSPNHYPQPPPTETNPILHPRPTDCYGNWITPPGHPGMFGPRPVYSPVQYPWQPTLHDPYSATNNNEHVAMHTLKRYPAYSNMYMDTGSTFHVTSDRVLGPRMDFSSKVAIKLLLKRVEEGEKKNILTSPLSFNAIMNMIAAGSSNDTLIQILQFLERKNIEEVNSEFSMFTKITCERKTEDEGITRATRNHENKGDAPIISFLNGAWLNEELKQKYPLKDSFVELVENLYKARIRNIDCTKPKMVVQETNEWANASTKGLIKEVLDEKHITPQTLLILGNALYFKGSWKKPFIKNRTRDDDFYLLNGEKIKVPFMTDCEDFSHKFFQDCKVARIPYSIGEDVNREFAMYIFLPYEKDGLQKLLKKVNSNSDFFKQHCDLPRTSTDNIVDTFIIPKFKFSYLTEDGKDIMKDMGLTLPFDRYKAEFYEMIEDKDLLKDDERVHVTDIIQKAFIEVNEEGTEAAAITYGVFGAPGFISFPRENIEFIADHPFMFIIREEKSEILFFIGTVLKPLEA